MYQQFMAFETDFSLRRRHQFRTIAMHKTSHKMQTLGFLSSSNKIKFLLSINGQTCLRSDYKGRECSACNGMMEGRRERIQSFA